MAQLQYTMSTNIMFYSNKISALDFLSTKVDELLSKMPPGLMIATLMFRARLELQVTFPVQLKIATG